MAFVLCPSVHQLIMSGADRVQDGIVKQGRVMKFENLRKTFRERYFILTATKIQVFIDFRVGQCMQIHDAVPLWQFLTADKEMGGRDGRVKGEFSFPEGEEASVDRSPEPVGSASSSADTFQFVIKCAGKSMHCTTHSDEDRAAWADAIEGRASAATEALKEDDLSRQGSIFQAQKPAAAKAGGTNEVPLYCYRYCKHKCLNIDCSTCSSVAFLSAAFR
jgi:hypothetical protein